MKRRYFTLIEIMIVIVLIGLISGVIAYNMRGSLDEGRMFKTQQGGAQVYNILMLELAKGRPLEEVPENWKKWVANSPLAKNPDALCQDGWGETYTVAINDGDILISSNAYTQQYQKQHGTSETQYLR